MRIDDYEVAGLRLFQNVNPASIRGWIDHCELQSFNAGHVILDPERENDVMYVIIDGVVSIRLKDVNNPPIAKVAEGECVGEMSVFDGKNPSAYVLAETPVKTLVIRRDVLLNLIDHSHGVARNLLYLLSNRLRSGNEAVSDSQRMQREFEQHANVDVLTGLHNRRWINTFFNRLMKRAEAEGQVPLLTVMMIDVDHFKSFNDEHGHLAGDHALRAVADALKNSVRPTDIVARYGGEEFLVMLPDTSADNALLVAERIRSSVENTPIKMGYVRYPDLTLSLGIAQLMPGDDFDAVIAAADKALYQAKQNGRNQVRTTHRELPQEAN